jgi:limonene-1,2-epoxide hydrolase
MISSSQITWQGIVVGLLAMTARAHTSLGRVSMKHPYVLSRRAAFFSVGGAAASVFITRAYARDISVSEEANAKLVKNFLKAWASPDTSGAKLADYVSDDCVLRFQLGKPAVVGKAAATTAFASYLTNGRRYHIEVLETFAKGPVVTTMRRDSPIIQGTTGSATLVVGVFIVRDGRISEWSDYLDKP